MDLYGILHWITNEVGKLAGQAEARIVHDSITALEQGTPAGRPVQPPTAPAAPAVEQGKAPAADDTNALLRELLAALKGGDQAPDAVPDPVPANGVAVDEGTPPGE
jgi:hypothetical protein